jgi:hypothetical protein
MGVGGGGWVGAGVGVPAGTTTVNVAVSLAPPQPVGPDPVTHMVTTCWPTLAPRGTRNGIVNVRESAVPDSMRTPSHRMEIGEFSG